VIGSTNRTRIVVAEAREEFILWLRFADGETREVELAQEPWGPMFEPLRADPNLFRQ